MPGRTRQRRAAPESAGLRQLGERVRQARVEAGLSQAQLGAPYYTRAHVSAIELGKIRPAMKSLEHIAVKLRKPLPYFLEDALLEQRRRELDFDVDRVAALAARATAADAVMQADAVLAREALPPRHVARLRLARGRSLTFLERAAEALADLEIAARLSAQIGDDGLRRQIAFETAAATRGVGDYRRARELFGELLATVERAKLPDQPLRMRILQALGAVSNDLGEAQAAAGYLRSALQWANDIGDVTILVSIYHGLAMSYRAQGDIETATAFLHRALSATEVANDLGSASVVHNMLAVIAAESGRNESAYEHADRAIALAHAAGPAAYVPHVLNTKAECAAKLGDWETAERVATESVEIARRLGNEWALAAARVVLSQVMLHRGDVGAGEDQLSEAAEVYRATGARYELADVLMRLSRSAKERGDIARAERYATQAFEATRSASTFVERV